MATPKTIDEYLAQLRTALAGDARAKLNDPPGVERRVQR